MPNYTKKNISEIKDSAAEHGVGEMQAARFGAGDVEAEDTGFAHIHVKPGQRQPFGHKHDDAEEIYFVVSGSGQVRLDDETVDLAEKDVLRVAAPVARRFQAGDDGLELLAFGAHHKGDGEILPDFWAPDEG
jgi:mannose-6-phosphate isomerase-like protein (cupin superfamily)